MWPEPSLAPGSAVHDADGKLWRGLSPRPRQESGFFPGSHAETASLGPPSPPEAQNRPLEGGRSILLREKATRSWPCQRQVRLRRKAPATTHPSTRHHPAVPAGRREVCQAERCRSKKHRRSFQRQTIASHVTNPIRMVSSSSRRADAKMDFPNNGCPGPICVRMNSIHSSAHSSGIIVHGHLNSICMDSSAISVLANPV